MIVAPAKTQKIKLINAAISSIVTDTVTIELDITLLWLDCIHPIWVARITNRSCRQQQIGFLHFQGGLHARYVPDTPSGTSPCHASSRSWRRVRWRRAAPPPRRPRRRAPAPAAAAGGCGRRPAPPAARPRPFGRGGLEQVVPAQRQREGAQVGHGAGEAVVRSRPPPSSRSPRPAAAPPRPAARRGRPPAWRAVSSTASISFVRRRAAVGELAADHVHGLDAVGALVDRRHPHVAVELRHPGLLDVAHAAEDLHGERADLAAGVGAEGLGDRRQERRARRPVLLAGRDAPCRSRARSRGRSRAPSPPSPPWSPASAARRRGR